MLNDISNANDNKSKDITLAICLDMSKAFDTIIVQLRTWSTLFLISFFKTVSKYFVSADSKSEGSQTQKVERFSKNR